jgi:hypothetical protein
MDRLAETMTGADETPTEKSIHLKIMTVSRV